MSFNGPHPPFIPLLQMVKNTKKKLADFADDTLAGISKHFRFLHGQLQNAELQTIEKLRECSLPPQTKLNEAMSKLNGYEMVLNVSAVISLVKQRSTSNLNAFCLSETTYIFASFGVAGRIFEGSDLYNSRALGEYTN